MDLKKENKQYPDQLGAKKESHDESSKAIKVIPGIHKSHLVVNRKMSMLRSTKGNVVQRQSMI